MTRDGAGAGGLVTPYADNHPHMVEIKEAQMGLTTKAMLRATYRARYRNFRGILYLFPSRTDVTEFAKGRIDTLIEDNPDTLGRWLQETDSANIKQIWNCFRYLRGMKSRVGLKSIQFVESLFASLHKRASEEVSACSMK
jgi:hypothetical protein